MMIRSLRISSIVLLAFVPALFGQPTADWGAVKQLTPNTEIRVSRTDGGTVQGRFQSATDDGVVVATSKSTETLNHTAIKKVETRGKNHRGRNALIGLGAGAAGGLIVGAASDSSCPKNGCFLVGKNFGKEVLTPFGALIGVVVGVVIPTGRWHDIYRNQ
jgi:hypothetical protein